MLRGFAITIFCTRRARSEAANDPLWTMRWLYAGAHHLRKEIDVVVCLARHLFADRVQDF